MKRYNITVNGNPYDVTVEEFGGATPVQSQVTAPVPASAPTPVAPAAPQGGGQGNIKINAPMNGNIIDVKVNVGDTVKNGTVIAILEAMKMENDIVSPSDGVIASIDVAKGATINTGALIATISG